MSRKPFRCAPLLGRTLQPLWHPSRTLIQGLFIGDIDKQGSISGNPAFERERARRVALTVLRGSLSRTYYRRLSLWSWCSELVLVAMDAGGACCPSDRLPIDIALGDTSLSHAAVCYEQGPQGNGGSGVRNKDVF